MARVNYTGFDTGNVLEAADSSNVTFSTSTRLNSGGYSLQVSPASTAAAWYALGCVGDDGKSRTTPVGVVANTSYAKFHVYFSSLPSVATEFFCVYTSDDASPLLILYINSSGTITVRDSDNDVVATASANLSASTWTRIEVFYDTDGTSTADVEVKINGTVVASASNIDTIAFDADQWCVGRRNSAEATAFTMFVEDFVVDDAAYPGNTRIALLTVTAAGDFSNWTASSGSGYQCVDELPHNGDTDYIWADANAESSFVMSDTTGTYVADATSYKSIKAILAKKSLGLDEV